MNFSLNKNFISLSIVVLVYFILFFFCLNNAYFWDTVQQVSKEANWFYLTDFRSLFVPENNEFGIFMTGYHPPLIGIITAFLWKIFGCHLWVSHAFVLVWAILLFYNSWKLIESLFEKKYVGWVFLICLLEPTILTQFAIASPDFILFTAFVVSLRAILEKKPLLLSMALFFLCCINMRGVFVGGILFVVYFYYLFKLEKGSVLKTFFKTLLPYIPTIICLFAYFTAFFYFKSWFFENSEYSEHYSMPTSLKGVFHHFLSFILRSVEYGRFIIWILAIYLSFLAIRKKEKLNIRENSLLLFLVLMNLVYVIFIFISQMPFSARYFLPQFFVLSLLVFLFLVKYFSDKTIKAVFILVLLLFLSGHFWIYPEIVAKPWDTSLSHLPYYNLRKQCFDYIDENNFNYDDISAGFCFKGDRGYTELENRGKIIKSSKLKTKYYIYSNISNLDDEQILALKDDKVWTEIKSFYKWPVSIVIYEDLSFVSKNEEN